ncbi:hypothetical protein LPB85_15210 [Chryseobacterium sp. LC2016-27]|uniref:hypothetical protein n=1 Tax=Chryseobacterium sp. LC2016-27 TaxID=2897326 RepID=UPI001E2BDC2E|nr:hypothetical protein [Chryseobacterium sp. LC2016-27]MCD0456796.1 hypothetical protein [Chryseobacterium sp. LC2016-27]
MKEFYHVSRADIAEINQFNLQHFPGYIETEGFFSAQEFKDFKITNYPNGISKHGEFYLHNPFRPTGPNLAFTPNELLLETTFELIRQLKFNNRKSRFEITFGCLNLDDAIKLKTEDFGGDGEIYKVSCEKHSIADMNLVRQAGSIIGLQVIAEKYWNGEASPSPFWEVLMENPVNILEKIQY